jgi:hypothetical protein
VELSAEGTFERNTKFVSSALRIIKRAEPQAVVMIGTYGPCAEFIKLAHKAGFHPTFVNVSSSAPTRWPRSSATRAKPPHGRYALTILPICMLLP